MLSLTTGIGFCKTKFHLSRGKKIYIVVSSADFSQILVMLSGLCIYVLTPSATLDRHSLAEARWLLLLPLTQNLGTASESFKSRFFLLIVLE